MPNLESKPSILQIIPNLGSGGAEKTTLDIAEAIIGEDWRSFVVSQGGRMVDELEHQGSTHIPLNAASKNPVKIIQNALKLVAVIRNNQISIIHARSRAPAWSALLASRICKIPFITTYHGAYKQSSWLKAFYNSVMVRSNITIANSNWTAEFIKSRYASMKLNIKVVYRGTDFDQFDLKTIDPLRQQRLRKHWDIDENQTVILNLARITALKGQRTLIEAIPSILQEFPDIIFVFAGDDSGHSGYRRKLEQLCTDYGVSNSVRFPGHCNDPAAAYSLSKISVVSSHQPETFGRVAVEAQALKSLVVVTDLGGAKETVLAPPEVDVGSRTGWRVPPNDSNALAKSILVALMTEKSTKNQINDRARAHVLAKFSTEEMCSKTIDIYRSIMN